MRLILFILKDGTKLHLEKIEMSLMRLSPLFPRTKLTMKASMQELEDTGPTTMEVIMEVQRRGLKLKRKENGEEKKREAEEMLGTENRTLIITITV